MTRYKTITPWEPATDRPELAAFDIEIQSADIIDTRTGHTYTEGAYRVISTLTGKGIRRGKGGTVPFHGETAWSDAERLAYDQMTIAKHAGYPARGTSWSNR